MQHFERLAGNHRQKLPLVKMAFVLAVCALHDVRADDVGTIMPWDPPQERISSTPNYVDTPAYTNYHAYPTFPGDRMGDNGLGAYQGGYGSMYGFPYFGAGVNFDFSEFLDDDQPAQRPHRRPTLYRPGGFGPHYFGGHFTPHP